MVARIKRRQTPMDRALYQLADRARRFEIPAPRAVYDPLRAAWLSARSARAAVERVLLFQPMLRARAESCGPGLRLDLGLPYLYGDLRLHLGAHCKINGRSAFAAASAGLTPTLTVGDHTNIGFGVVISVADRITLGSHVRVADGCYLSDHPGHPLDPEARRSGAPPPPERIKPITLEDDVWLGTRVVVLPGVRIGRGTVIGAHSVVTRDIPPMCVAAGAPARVIRRIDTPLRVAA